MSDLRDWFGRLYSSSVVWSWALNGFRVAGGVLLLPLLLRVLPRADLGMYYVFLNLYALLPVLDFGFSVSVARYVSYAMGGATELQPQGLTINKHGDSPNFQLLWQLLFTTRNLFRYIALASFVLVGLLGTWAVGLRVQETAVPWQTWLAWAITLVSLVFEIYAGWWNHFLRGMNEVLLSARIAVLSYGLKLVLAGILLLVGGGLLAFPAAGLVGSLLQRQLSRQSCLHRLKGSPVKGGALSSILRILWPNSWRVGLQFLSTYLATSANALICLKVLGLPANAQYGLSMQIAQISAGMAYVWVMVKWPLIGQYRSQHHLAGIRSVLWPRLWLQAVTYVVLAGAAFFLGPHLLAWLGTNKQLLPSLWFGLLLLNTFFEMQFSFWTTLLSLENRIPSLWPTVISNVLSLSLVLILVHFSSLGLGAFILAPFLIYSLFSYWYWPWVGAKSLETSWFRFTFSKPRLAPVSMPESLEVKPQ